MDTVNIQLTEWKKIFTKYKTNKGLMFKIYKKLLGMYNEKQQPKQKNEQEIKYPIYRRNPRQ